MLTYNDFVENFSDPVTFGRGLIRCADELPRSTFYYYIKFESENSGDLLIVSENRVDDDFVLSVFSNLVQSDTKQHLQVKPLPSNKYGFSELIVAPNSFHSYFKGRLDNKCDNLSLCIPAHISEFSGNERVEEFVLMRRDFVPTLDWARKVSPKIVLRFDNPKTGAGTASDVLVKYDTLVREVKNLNGVGNGFLEISNYQREVCEVLSPTNDKYVFISDRDDSKTEAVSEHQLLTKLWRFLTE